MDRFRPKDLMCKKHRRQPRYGCCVCVQEIKALVDKTLLPR
jgi:hypothetical protein